MSPYQYDDCAPCTTVPLLMLGRERLGAQFGIAAIAGTLPFIYRYSSRDLSTYNVTFTSAVTTPRYRGHRGVKSHEQVAAVVLQPHAAARECGFEGGQLAKFRVGERLRIPDRALRRRSLHTPLTEIDHVVSGALVATCRLPFGGAHALQDIQLAAALDERRLATATPQVFNREAHLRSM